MAADDYTQAYKLGKKDYLARMHRGVKPTLQVLDDVMPQRGAYSEMPLGIVQIPIDQIVGTKNVGRSNSFSGNFMPILEMDTEFANKWTRLCKSHVEEGIHTPIKAYEYMNKFYVEEGNKRVSVMKYFGAVSIPGEVIRIVPERTNEKENKIYYEFMDFYECAPINYIWFSQEGSFARLQEAVGKKPDEKWSAEELVGFNSVYSRFSSEYKAQGGNKLKITVGDAFLSFICLYGYKVIDEKTTNEMKDLILKSWEEFELLQEGQEIDLKMSPNQEKKPLLTRLLPISSPKLKAAFLYEKTPATSEWTYAHELGRYHLEQTFPDELETVCYENVTVENVEAFIQEAIDADCNLIFTTMPSFVQASVKAAIANPQVRIMNCSLNTSHRYIRTYYPRMHEAKFMMGAIAGAMAENNRLAYVADHRDYGSIANINAFALGAKMINPRAQVYLEWIFVKEPDIHERIRETGASCISGKDMIAPEEGSRIFGIYHTEPDGHLRNLAMPLWHWGKFYEQLIRTIMDGTWKYDDDKSTTKAINYWWGMAEGVVDMIYSQYLPIGTKRLVKLLKRAICSGVMNPFSGILYSQNGIIEGDPDQNLQPEKIITMDWLAENVIGEIPRIEDGEDTTP